MTTPITIREVKKNEKSFAATVQFDVHGAPYEITVSDPFSEQEEAHLEWYFERWLEFPFTDKVSAKQAAAGIRNYGEALFEQVFRHNPDIYHEYRGLRAEEIYLEIIGSPEFHALHWEALHDPKDERPLAVEALVVRKNLKPVIKRAKVKDASQLRVLLVTARPAGVGDVSYRTISRPLVEALETGKVGAQIDIVRPGTFEALVNHLENIRDEHGDGYYHIIHLDMHGALLTYEQYQEYEEKQNLSQYTFRSSDYAQTAIETYQGQKAFLFFDDAGGKADGGSDPVSADDLAGLLNMRQIPIVIINACQSGKQVGNSETSLGSRLLVAGVQLVVAMGYSVTVSAARLLMTTLYRQLLAGREPAVAIRRARLELYNDKRRRAVYGQEIKLEDWLLPVIYQNQPPEFKWNTHHVQVISMPAAYAPPRTTYHFVGRDIDILQVERYLLHRHNLLLMRGMGGAGKTTLLHHLGWWWQKTRFVTQVFYFGYDVKAYHLPEIVSTIGRKLELNLSGIGSDDRAAVLHALKSTRHLLILDNLESITGERLAVQNTLSTEAQEELRSFLQQLEGTRSLVLLGSRGSEAWLQPDPLCDVDIYDLPGLDYEAQTILAEAILRTWKAPHYPELKEHQDDFRRLLKLLGGYPLAMEVVLANLVQANPGQIIERLQAADVNLDIQKEAAQKTESILKCIDYSHSNLSAEAQALLLCLAPFTAVINRNWLDQYTAELKAQPILADLPYEQWPMVLQEAISWGLLQPHEQFKDYLCLQPVFPYFLKSRLNDKTQTARKKAIEEAFRAYYNGMGGRLVHLISSKDAQERQTGHILIGVEEENLLGTVQIALRHKKDFWNAYTALNQYFNRARLPQKRLLLSQSIIGFEYDFKDFDNDFSANFLWAKYDLGNVLLDTQKYEGAKQCYHQVLEEIDTIADWSSEHKQQFKASIVNNLGLVAQGQRLWEAAEKYYKEALQIKINLNDHYEQAKTLHQLGGVAIGNGQWEAAEKYYKEALQIFINLNACYEQALTLHNLGVVAYENGQWEAAEKYYKEALQIKINLNDYYEQAKTLHNLGMVAQKQGLWEEAEGYYKEALQIKTEFNKRYEQAHILNNLGVLAYENGQWEAAEKYYKEALQIYIDFNDRFEQARTLNNLRMVAQKQRQWEAAEKYYKEALQICIDFNDRFE